MLVTRQFEFDAAHYIDGYKGNCGNMHGHSWKFTVTVDGQVDPHTSMVIDFKALKEIVNKLVVDKLDHKILNHIIGVNPTAENLAKWIYEVLYDELKTENYYLENVKLWENYPNCYVEYYGG